MSTKLERLLPLMKLPSSTDKGYILYMDGQHGLSLRFRSVDHVGEREAPVSSATTSRLSSNEGLGQEGPDCAYNGHEQGYEHDGRGKEPLLGRNFVLEELEVECQGQSRQRLALSSSRSSYTKTGIHT
jgi:hypothetical protein